MEVNSGMLLIAPAAANRKRCVLSKDDPSGKSSITWTSDLLSKGRSFTVTALVTKNPIEATVARATATNSIIDRLRLFRIGPAT